MSTKANPTIVGAFIVVAVALLVAGVIVFGGSELFSPKVPYVAYFEGSVRGLRIGAPVYFRGVRVGMVTDIVVRVDPDADDVAIPVVFELEPDRIERSAGSEYPGEAESRKRLQRMIDKGLRAHLATESFITGQLAIELDIHPDKPARYVGKDELYPEFPTVPSARAEQIKTLKELPLTEIFAKLNSAIEGIDKLVNAPETIAAVRGLGQTMKDVQKLIGNIDKQVEPVAVALTDTLHETQKLVKRVDAQVDPVASSLTGTLDDTRKLVKRVDAQVDPVAGSLIGTLDDTRKLVKNVDGQVKPVAEKLLAAIDDARSALQQADKTLAATEGIVSKDSKLRYEVTKAIKELAAAARAIRLAAEYLKQHPESLIHGKAGTKGN